MPICNAVGGVILGRSINPENDITTAIIYEISEPKANQKVIDRSKKKDRLHFTSAYKNPEKDKK